MTRLTDQTMPTKRARCSRAVRLWVMETNRIEPEGPPTCRCYRCLTVLTEKTMTVDRIVPGAHGGTYRKGNVRPACKSCNSTTGGGTMRKVRKSAF